MLQNYGSWIIGNLVAFTIETSLVVTHSWALVTTSMPNITSLGNFPRSAASNWSNVARGFRP